MRPRNGVPIIGLACFASMGVGAWAMVMHHAPRNHQGDDGVWVRSGLRDSRDEAAWHWTSIEDAFSSGQMPLDDAAVAASIEAGTTRKNMPFVSSCLAMSWGLGNNGTAEVMITTTAGYIALLADIGRQLYSPITVADIASDLRIPRIHVIIGNVKGMGVKQVVLKSKTSPEAFVAPEQVADGSSLDELRLLQRGTLGGLFARFSYEAVRGLPPGEIDVVLLNHDLKEVRCKIGRSDRAKLFPASLDR